MSTVALPSDSGKPKAIRLVDLAGHARLRDQVGEHVETADAVVFVVDVVALVRNAAAAAEYVLLSSVSWRTFSNSTGSFRLS